MTDGAPFNRRSLLTKLGGAAVAGVGAAVAGSTLQAQPAAAAPTEFASTDSHAVIARAFNQLNAGVLGTNLDAGPSGQRMGVRGEVRADNGSFGVFGVHGDRHDAGAAPAAVVGTSTAATGVAGYTRHSVAVLGQSQEGPTAVRGLLGALAPFMDAETAAVQGVSEWDHGIFGSSFSDDKAGVRAIGNGHGLEADGHAGYGVVAKGGRAQLRLVPMDVAIDLIAAPEEGGILLNSDGTIWVGTPDLVGPAGSPPRWRKVLYAEGEGTTHLLEEPIRLLDTRPDLPSRIPYEEPLSAGEVRHFTVTAFAGTPEVPDGVAGLVGSIAVTGPTNAGHLQLFPGHLETTSTSVINFVAGQTVANAFTVGLSPHGLFKIGAMLAPPGGTVHVIIDITGYIS